jgi:hypothetical protein
MHKSYLRITLALVVVFLVACGKQDLPTPKPTSSKAAVTTDKDDEKPPAALSNGY